MAEYLLGSGSKLLVNPAKYEAASALRNIVLRSLKGKLGEVSKIDVKDATAQGAAIMDLILEVSTDPDFEAALFRCGEQAVYTPVDSNAMIKVGAGLYNDLKVGDVARTDHLEIAWRIVEVNVLPFLLGIFSRLKTVLPTTIDSLKLRSASTKTP